MSYYQLCCQHKGKVVHIYEKTGKVHCGRIVEVDREYVWLDPMVRGPRGFGYGYGGGYGGYRYGRNPYFVPVALAAVGGFALGAAFFW
ncbi:hypothetical protein BKP37_13990 [Anaerobacillus alkalilacustris]|uniref:Uncharacterized protein n=1 Tax=Anaerobacillus alkalilacustris TaxID=393763 RepID=A0A1S2LKA8_9BACI|nr:hypothetical protein [Anaerobacillus alkalilacustris]OIJ12533.1 hypothetical protein BKP37_13990 [Anaerobacillus alkalilacustris]